MRIGSDEVNSGPVNFTLNRAFTVEEVLVDAKPVSYEREGDWLTIQFPEQNQNQYELTVRYKGRLIIPSNSNYDVYYGFSSGENTYLGGVIGWYPVPGKQSIYGVGTSGGDRKLILSNTLQVEPVDMRIAFKDFESEMYTTLTKTEPPATSEAAGQAVAKDQIFEGKQTVPVTAIGASFSQISSSVIPLTVYASTFGEHSAEHVLSMVEDQYMYFKSWIPELTPQYEQVFMFGDLLFLSNIYEIHNQSYIHNELNSSHDEISARNWMNALMFGDQAGMESIFSDLSNPDMISEESFDLRHLIGLIFWYVYYIDYEDKTKDEAMNSSYLPYYLMRYEALNSKLSRVAENIVNQVNQAMDAGKMEQMKQVLHHFYEQGLSMSWSEPSAVKFITPRDWNEEWDRVMKDE